MLVQWLSFKKQCFFNSPEYHVLLRFRFHLTIEGFFCFRLHLTIVCSLCLLSLIGGVYSKMNITGTQVHITVYAPKHFFTQKIEVFFHQDKPAYVVDNPYTVQAYGRYRDVRVNPVVPFICW